MAPTAGLALLAVGLGFAGGVLLGWVSLLLVTDAPGEWLWRGVLWGPLILAAFLAARSIWKAWPSRGWIVLGTLGGLAGFAAFWGWLLLSLEPGD